MDSQHHPWARIGGPPEHVLWFADPTIPTYQPQVDPSAVIQPFVTVDSGIHAPTRVGARTLLLAHVHIGHDAQVGEDCQIATGTVVGGHANIGNWVKIGINATILPFRTIGDGATIGAGAVVTKDVGAGETWVGNPARKLEAEERDPRVHTERIDVVYPEPRDFTPGSVKVYE
jgi:acyl-[acyl carrier protein]--UDP-N-acetylglucosamine O-acyltransferase